MGTIAVVITAENEVNMSNNSFIITAHESEILSVATLAHEEKRFLSDTPNIENFTWYPLGDSEMQAMEIELVEGADIPNEELSLLTEHYTSMDIGVLTEDNSVAAFISGGEVAEVD